MQLSAVGAHAGVRDDDIEPAELFDAAVDRGFEAVEVADIDLRGDDAPVVVLDQFGGFGEILRRRMWVGQIVDRSADVYRDDVGAFFGQSDSVAAALAARRSADERDLALDAAAHDVEAGIDSHPRTVDVGLSVALVRSTSHSGKRLRISSNAMRPSRRASAEPRQKWVPTLKARC